MASKKTTRIFVAGHLGMVGSAIIRQLKSAGSTEVVTKTRNELDLTNQAQVERFFSQNPLDEVYLTAAKVGGIHANNTYPAEFIYQNLMIEANVINAAFRTGVKKMLFLGSSCIYPREAKQPIREDALLAGNLEPTNEPYAIAKIAGIKLCESYSRQYGGSHGISYRSAMPTNLYGPGDNYHPEDSHVIPALIRRFHEAKTYKSQKVSVWGSGAPRREFLHVDDLARACLHLMEIDEGIYSRITEPTCRHVNIGSGSDLTIKEIAEMIAEVVKFEGRIEFDTSRPDGTPRKLMSSQRLRSLGWSPSIGLKEGLIDAYADYCKRFS